jgi:hypothetical protein
MILKRKIEPRHDGDFTTDFTDLTDYTDKIFIHSES